MALPKVAMRVGGDGQISILDRPVFVGDDAELFAALEELRGLARPALVATPNVDQLVLASELHAAAEALQSASLLLLDGMPLVWLARLIGTPMAKRHTGADLLIDLPKAASTYGCRIAILGGRPTVAAEAVRRLKGDGAQCDVVAVEVPVLASPQDPASKDAVALLNSLRPDYVFVCMGFPKQELWFSHWISELPAAVYVGAGAAVDFAAGEIPRAPKLMQAMGLEWLHRLLREPRRLAFRYLIRGPRVIPIFVRSILGRAM